MNDYINTVSNGELILHVNLFFSVFFSLVALLLVGTILYMRYQKLRENRKIQKRREILSDFMMRYLFENPNDEQAIEAHQPQNNLQLRTAVQVIMEFVDNFKGESLELLRKLFYAWRLQKYVQHKLQSKLWYDVAQSIYISSELKLEEMREHVVKHTNSTRKEIRQQAIFYLINMAQENPLSFLHQVDKPLSVFEQIYIKDCMDTQYTGVIPEFGEYLEHPLESVQIFALKMIAEYNQFESIGEILPFLESEREELRIAAIESLSKLEYPELSERIEQKLPSEKVSVRSHILRNLKRKYSLGDFQNLVGLIPETDYKNRVLHFNLANSLRKESKKLYI